MILIDKRRNIVTFGRKARLGGQSAHLFRSIQTKYLSGFALLAIVPKAIMISVRIQLDTAFLGRFQIRKLPEIRPEQERHCVGWMWLFASHSPRFSISFRLRLILDSSPAGALWGVLLSSEDTGEV
jgi:hypothetical protein